MSEVGGGDGVRRRLKRVSRKMRRVDPGGRAPVWEDGCIHATIIERIYRTVPQECFLVQFHCSIIVCSKMQ